MDCMNKLKSNKVRGQPLGTPPRMLVLTQPSVGGCLHHSLGHTARGWGTSWLLCPARLAPPRLQEYLEFRKERSQMLLSRRNQLLLEFSFWNEPQPRAGPNIYELRTYKLKVPPPFPAAVCCPGTLRGGGGPSAAAPGLGLLASEEVRTHVCIHARSGVSQGP